MLIDRLTKNIQRWQQQMIQYPAGDSYGDKVRMYYQQDMLRLQQVKAGTYQGG
jgi:hypothetical protein